ncbi:hypothetical protein [Caudoviricetes sp.]|nr:hypothetical protein [Caudoviricetes sp.]
MEPDEQTQDTRQPVQDSQDPTQITADALLAPETPRFVLVLGVLCEVLEGPGIDENFERDLVVIHPVTGDPMQVCADDYSIWKHTRGTDALRRLKEYAKESAALNNKVAAVEEGA